jgi:hypothetical protein
MLNLPHQQNIMTGDEGGGYFFMPVVQLTRDLGIRLKPVTEWSDEEAMQVKQKYQECFENLHSLLTKAENALCPVFVKEHTTVLTMVRTPDYLPQFGSWTVTTPETINKESSSRSSNPTVLPDEFMRTWQPTFLIRHPALAFPSLYRALGDIDDRIKATGREKDMEHFWRHRLTLRWSRALYDWYERSFGGTQRTSSPCSEGTCIQWPVVLDADDIMENPELVRKYAQLVRMDPSCVINSWAPTAGDWQTNTKWRSRRMYETLLSSEGIDAGKVAGDVDLDEQATKWRWEFGETTGRRLEMLVRDAMPDYEYLKARRLRA